MKEAYVFLHDQEAPTDKSIFRCFWGVHVPSNVSAFAWRMLMDRIQAKENLRKINIEDETTLITLCFHAFLLIHLETVLYIGGFLKF